MVESLFRDGTASWVRIVNGVDKYVTETTETTPTGNVERRSSGKLVAKARPQLKPAVTLSPISIPLCERKWIDINPERFHQDCFTVSKATIRLLRHHPSIPGEDDGAVRFDEIMKEFKAKFDGVSQWSINDWMSFLNNTEIFELYETSSKQQCPDCNFFCEVGFVYCTCGRCLRLSRSEKEVDKSNNDVVSIPGYFIKKNNKRGARHGPSERQRMYYKAQEMLHKAGQKKHGGHSSILARWHNEYSYRDSLTRIGWTEQDIMLFDRVAWENHSYVATRAERIRNSEHWILKLNQDGAQQPLNQRPDFAQTKRECKRLHDEYLARTQQEYRTSPRSQQVRRRKEQAFEGIEEYDYAVDPRTGCRFFKPAQGNLSLSSPSSSSTTWDRNNLTTRSWNSWHSSRSDYS